MATCFAAGAACRRIVGHTPAEVHRDRYLDGLRGVAAVSVLASHYGNNVAGSLGLAPMALFHNLGSFGVQVFFAITGLLFTRKAVAARGQLAIGPFAAARVRRIVPMYTLAVLASVALAVVVQNAVPTSAFALARETVALYAFGFLLDGAPSIRGLPYDHVIGTIWTLPFEWMFYLFVPLLSVLLRSWRLAAIAAVALVLYYGNRMWGGAQDVFSPFFLPGMVMGLLPRVVPPAPVRLALIAVALVLAIGAIVPETIQDFSALRLSVMLPCFAAVVLAAPPVLARPRVAFLGDISYSVYLVHFPALFVTLAVFNSRHVGLFSPYPRALGFLVSAAVVIAVSAATFRWVERPFLRRAAVTAA